MQKVETNGNGNGWGVAAKWLGLGLTMLAQIAYFSGRLSAVEAIIKVHDGIAIESKADRVDMRDRVGKLEALFWRMETCERRLDKHESREDRHEVSR